MQPIKILSLRVYDQTEPGARIFYATYRFVSSALNGKAIAGLELNT